MLNFNFLITFYDQDTKSPIFIIETNDDSGVRLQGSVANARIPGTSADYKSANLTLYKLDFSFVDKLKWHDVCEIRYRTGGDPTWKLLFNGYCSLPEDGDSPNGDYIVKLSFFQLAAENSYKAKIPEKNRNLQGMTIGAALRATLGEYLHSINLPPDKENAIITKPCNVFIINDVINKLSPIGGFKVRTDYGVAIPGGRVAKVFIITDNVPRIGKYFYAEGIAKNLTNYKMTFIPQQTVSKNDPRLSYLLYWTVSVRLTTEIMAGDSVYFFDKLGKERRGIVENVNHSFTNVGDCSTHLKILDIKSTGAEIPKEVKSG